MSPTRRRSTRRSGGRAQRHADTLFSDDGSTVDEQVAALLRGQERSRQLERVATAESCTGGLLAARLTELPGSSDYVKGGIVVYSERGEGRPGGRAPPS